MADLWWTSLVSGFVGAVAGAVSTRQLADRSDHRKQLYDAYVKWVVLVTGYEEASWPSAGGDAAYRALWAARVTLDLLEPDPGRRKEMREITAHAIERDLQNVGERLEALTAAVRRTFAERVDG